jgi:hypothetical protein
MEHMKNIKWEVSRELMDKRIDFSAETNTSVETVLHSIIVTKIRIYLMDNITFMLEVNEWNFK